MNRLVITVETVLQHTVWRRIAGRGCTFAECHARLPIANMWSSDPHVRVTLRLLDNRRKETRGC